MDVDVPEKANGVLYALGGFSAGLTCYVKDGVLCYEYNLFEIQRTQIKAKDKLPAGKVTIEVESKLAAARPGSPMDVTLKVDGKVVAQGRVPMTAPHHVHRERLPRHRQRPRLPGVEGLLRPGPVPVQRHHRHHEDRVREVTNPRGITQARHGHTTATRTVIHRASVASATPSARSRDRTAFDTSYPFARSARERHYAQRARPSLLRL